jgi:hypothetical protein
MIEAPTDFLSRFWIQGTVTVSLLKPPSKKIPTPEYDRWLWQAATAVT